MKLTEKEVYLLKLILRSPDRGDGWRSFSSVSSVLIRDFGRKELIEVFENGDGTGAVRLSKRGRIVVDYI